MERLCTVDELTKLGVAIFKAAGATEENATAVVTSLIGANLSGHDSHGLIRIPNYVDDIKKGRLQPRNTPCVAHETPSTAVIDGNSTFGQLGARLTVETAARKARDHGIAGAAAFRCHHTGRIGEWGEVGASQGMVTLVFASGAYGPHHVAPFGGTSAALGTNPLACAVPRPGGQPPILLDFATAAAAQGKLMVARGKRVPVPGGWILDTEGRPTTDVEDFYRGGVLLPFAGHKGYALSVIVELLAVGLSGGDVVARTERGSCLFVVCIDPRTLRPDEGLAETVERIARRLKTAPRAEGVEEILLPGEPEARTRTQRLRDGIPLPDATWQALVTVARDLGCDDR